jgi:hypothetical protein
MKPEIKWVKKTTDNECHYEAILDNFNLFVFFDDWRHVIFAYAGSDGGKLSFSKYFIRDAHALDDAKAWCESQLPYLIAEEICDEAKD